MILSKLMLYKISSLELVVINIKSTISVNQVCSRSCTEMICLCSKTYCCYDAISDKYKFSSKGLNKRILEETGDGPLEKYRRVMEEIINLTSTNRGFRTINHCVATYEQTKKGLSCFYPKRKMLSDGIHTVPLNL